jgi:acyl transferase domain-containing protein/NADPH:quinone reductase-like Zn-dependent oxidoreductase/acyl carrier protein
MSTSENAAQEPIAIIGMSCRFPGAEDPEALWKMVKERRESVAEYFGGRTPQLDAFYQRAGMANGPASSRGGFLRDIDKFDAAFFEISPREAEWLDPQQRLLLEGSWEALEDAGIPLSSLSKEKTGVFIGVWLSEYEQHAKTNAPVADFFLITGGPLYGTSSRISFQFDLRGADVSVNAACGSSLVAVHLATRSLRSGECSLALAGGVNVQVGHECTQAFTRAKMLSPDGRCKFGAAGADGFVRSDGVGLLVLKRLSDAQRDGDHVLGLILGTGMANDGRGSGLLATPSASGQRDAMLAAVHDAGIDPKTVDFVEAHGTGTRAGDPIELSAISSVFGRKGSTEAPCRTASVKSNIGHTESAAGVASIIRVLKAMQNQEFPVSLHAKNLNPEIDWDELGVRLEREGRSWLQPDRPRRASVNGLSLTGTNAHVILEEAPNSVMRTAPAQEANILLLSAGSENALVRQMSNFGAVLSSLDEKLDSSSALYDICYSAAVRRTHLPFRRVVIGQSARAMREQLDAAVAGVASPSVFGGVVEGAQKPKIAFVFPGQGSQWVGMGRELLRSNSVFRCVLEELDVAIKTEAGWSVLQQLEDPGLDERLTRIDVIQPTLFAIEVALAELWRSWGLVPGAVVGHSMGEVAAACVAGILSYKDAVSVICRRSTLLMGVAGAGAMVVVDLPRDEAVRQIAGIEDKVSVAVSNSPRSTVLAGDPATLDVIVQRLEAEEIFCRWIRVDVASHSPQMDPLKNDLLTALEQIKPAYGNVSMFSTVRSGFIEPDSMGADYWVSNLREPVLFANAIEKLICDGFDTFIEMSPHPILVPFVEQTAAVINRQVLTINSLRREEPELATLMMSAGRLHTAGTELDWKAIYPAGNLVKLPAYPWQRERFWLDSKSARLGGAVYGKGHPLLGEPLQTATNEYIWTTSISLDSHPWLKDHGVGGSILLPASVYIEMAAAASRLIFDASTYFSDRLSLIEATPFRDGATVEMQVVASPNSQNEYSLRFFTRDSGAEDWIKTSECSIRAAEQSVIGTESLAAWEDAEFSPMVSLGGDHSRRMAELGYDFGPSFSQLDWLVLKHDSALARISVSSEMRRETYRMHPATIDAALQMVGRLLGERATISSPLLPVSIKSAEWSNLPMEGENLYARATISPEKLEGDVEVLNDRGEAILVVRSIEFRPFASIQTFSTKDAQFGIKWIPLSGIHAEEIRKLPKTWLLIGGPSADSKYLTSVFEEKGIRVSTITTDQFLSESFVANRSLHGAVWLDALTLENTSPLAAAQAVLADGALVVAKASGLEVDAFRLWCVTRSTQAIIGDEDLNVMGAGCWGLFATASNEYPSLRASCVDFEMKGDRSEIALFAEILLGDPDQERVALRQGRGYSQLLVRGHANNSTISRNTIRQDQDFELELAIPGTLNSFELVSRISTPLAYGEIEIEVYAAGLNFADILRAMALHEGLSGSHFGGECAGRVRRIGPGVVKFREGDEVLAISPSFSKSGMFASRVVVPEILSFAKPSTMTFTEASGIPCVFLTAWYGLVKLARLERGERVLIHSAAGGVGLAAIQIAKWIGAEIYATVGSDEKRAFIERLGVKHVMNSRRLDFEREITVLTDGEGVDVVLNSLSGSAISAGLASMGRYGRFVEIGKRDILENSKIGLNAFQQNRSLFAVDLAQAVEDRREMVSRMFGEVMELFEQGIFSTLPTTVFSIGSASEAFRYMAKGEHIGKIAFDVKDESKAIRIDRSRLRSDATYLITGGTGGLGLATAKLFVDRGARHLVLVSRGGANPKTEEMLKALKAFGAIVVVRNADLSIASDVDSVFQEIRTSMPPLRGVVHAAGILDDAVISGLTRFKFETVMTGKVSGAQVIDERIKPGEIDFLLYYSSVAGIIGTPGQGNYAAANAMLDALAYSQRARGIPAISINWGTWSEVGLAAVGDNRGKRIAHQGLKPFSQSEGAVLLTQVLSDAPAQAVVMQFDANKWCGSHPAAKRAGLFAEVLHQSVDKVSEADGGLQSLHHLPPGEMRAVLLPWLRQQVATVLRLDHEKVSVDKPLRALGIDSLMALEVRNRLERYLQIKLSATLVWNYPTLSLMAPYLESRVIAMRTAEIEVQEKNTYIESRDTSIPSGNSIETTNNSLNMGSSADLLEAELLGAEDLLNTLGSDG